MTQAIQVVAQPTQPKIAQIKVSGVRRHRTSLQDISFKQPCGLKSKAKTLSYSLIASKALFDERQHHRVPGLC